MLRTESFIGGIDLEAHSKPKSSDSCPRSSGSDEELETSGTGACGLRLSARLLMIDVILEGKKGPLLDLWQWPSQSREE